MGWGAARWSRQVPPAPPSLSPTGMVAQLVPGEEAASGGPGFADLCVSLWGVTACTPPPGAYRRQEGGTQEIERERGSLLWKLLCLPKAYNQGKHEKQNQN